MKVDELMREANKLGACEKSGLVSDWKSLAWLFFTPQGEEFCIEHNFPSLEMFNALECDLTEYGVYVDAGNIWLDNPRNAAIIGDTRATIDIRGNACVHKIMLMHGAKAVIHASNYAVVRLIDEEMKAEVDKDETSIILY